MRKEKDLSLIVESNIKEFIPINEKIGIWSDSIIWKIKNNSLYSDWFHQYFKQLKPVLIKFMKEGYNPKIADIYNYNYTFLRRLAYWFTKYENIAKALLKTNGWQGRLGLEIAIMKLKLFNLKKERLPIIQDSIGIRISGAIERGNWRKFGIKSWNDLLQRIFGKINRENDIYIGKEGLIAAERMLKEFFNLNQRIPKAKEMAGIQVTCCSGYWKKFGIKSWNDLLQLTFGKVNNKYEHWKGKKGFIKAKNKALEFYKLHKRLPKSTDKPIQGIVYACNNNAWKNQGIRNWNDFLKIVFGQVNLELNIWSGNLGFKKAKKWMLDFFEKNHRLPKSADNSAIYEACRKGFWKIFGIKSWDDFLKLLFGKTNRERPSWKGKKGLIKAIERVKNFYSNNNRLPNTDEKGFFGIYQACKRGYWKELNVHSWVQFRELSISNFPKTLK